MKKIYHKVAALSLAAAMVVTSVPMAAQAEESGSDNQTLRQELSAYKDRYPDGGFAFYKNKGKMTEGDRDKEIQLIRLGGTEKEASVDLKCLDMTAKYGEDYEVYVKEKGKKVKLEAAKATQTLGEVSVNRKEAVSAKEKSADNATEKETTESSDAKTAPVKGSSLLAGYKTQTGRELTRTDWRQEWVEYQAKSASIEAENELINTFDGAMLTVDFAPGEYEKKVYIHVFDDSKAEIDEDMAILLGNATVGMSGEKGQYSLTILDNEKEEKIVFSMKEKEVVVDEKMDYARLTIVRNSGLNYYASASYQTVAGTARPSVAYRPLDGGKVAFAPGEKEKTIDIPLLDGRETGMEFSVKLVSDDIFVKKGAEATSVWIGEKQDKEALKIARQKAMESELPQQKAERIGSTWYDTKTITNPNVSAYTHSKSNLDQTAETKKSFKDDFYGASKVKFETRLYGSSKTARRYRAKNGRISVMGSGNAVAYHEVGNGTESQSYIDTLDLSYSESNNGTIRIRANTDSLCRTAGYELNKATIYYPQYTVTMQNAAQMLKGKNYTSTNNSTTFDVPALPGGSSWTSQTVRRGGSISLVPGQLQDGVYVKGYKIYNTKKEQMGYQTNATLSYDTLNNLRARYDSVFRSGNYQIIIEPEYAAYDSQVSFESQDASCIGFSGDKAGGSEFRTGQTLKCTQIDKVTFTAGPINTQNFSVSSVKQQKELTNKNGKVVRADYQTHIPSQAQQKGYTATIDVDNAKEYLQVYYKEPTLTVRYHEDEVTAENANAGAVQLSNAADSKKVLGTSTYESACVLEQGIGMLSTTFLAQVIMGEGFEHFEAAGIPFTTKTLWSMKEKGAQVESAPVMGNSYLFIPPYADTEVSYYFKAIQDDEHQVGVDGTVYIAETPLFSGGKRSEKSPAVGVKVNIGGYNTTTTAEGSYHIDANFNKNEYVGANLQYDTLSMAANLATGKNKQHDFTICADTADKLQVIDSSLTRHGFSSVRGMDNKPVEIIEKDGGVTLEDIDYTLHLQVQGSAGVVPQRAEYHFYDKKGQEKKNMMVSVPFSQVPGQANIYNSDFTLNPMSVGTLEKSLAVGDSITVKLYDTKGNGYFEHQTSLVIAQKLAGMYTFNYEGEKREDDNLFVKAIGNISIGYDFVLDLLSGEGGTYIDNNGTMHRVMYAGLGEGFGDPEDANNVKNATIEHLQKATTTGILPMLPKKNDALSFTGSDTWGLDLQVGAIMDGELVEEGERKGQYKFSDYVLIGSLNGRFNKEWDVTLGPVELTFVLDFTSASDADSSGGTGIKWHFYPKEGKEHYIASESAINVLASDDIESRGDISVYARILGGLDADVSGVIGAGGELTVEFNNHFAHSTDGWRNSGAISLKPYIKLKLFGLVTIPIWTQVWRYDYGNENSRQASISKLAGQSLEEADILHISTDNRELVDLSYMDQASRWKGNMSQKAFSALKASKEGLQEKNLKDGLFDSSRITMQEMGDGKYLAVFLDGVEGRADIDKVGAYYTIYDGSTWSAPVLLNDDGTADELPVICKADGNRYLVIWSSANEKLDASANMGAILNQYNLQGRFYDAGTGEWGDVEEITRNTKLDDVSDTNPQAIYDEETNTIKVYYTKSEYTVTDAEEGEVVGDLLNPYQVTAVRNYDVTNKKWMDTYTDKQKAEMKESLEGITLDEYEKNWYGQEFLDLAPAIKVEEEVDEFGYWTEDGKAQITDVSLTDAMAKEGDAISYNHLGLYAYALDKGGMAQTTNDQNLYLQIYNFKEEEYHHPIQITSRDAEIGDIQFIRAKVPKSEFGETEEVTYLYWLEDGLVKRINVSNLVANCLIKRTVPGETVDLAQLDARSYYYVDKAGPEPGSEEDCSYEPEEVVAVSVPNETTEDNSSQITSFKVKQNGDYNYVVWSELTPADTKENEVQKMESHLYATKENSLTGECSKAVQITDEENQYISKFDFAVTEEGNLAVMANAQELKQVDGEGGDEKWEPDVEHAKLTYMTLKPSDQMEICDVETGEVLYSEVAKDSEEGEPVVGITAKVKNGSLGGKENLVIEVKNQKNEVIFTAGTDKNMQEDGDENVGAENEVIDLCGGSSYLLEAYLPVGAGNHYAGTICVKDKDGKELASKKIEGNVSSTLSVGVFEGNIVERNKVALSAEIFNKSVLDSDETEAIIGYKTKDGQKKPLQTVKVPKLESGTSTTVACEAEVDFKKFTKAVNEDGSQTDSMEFYLDVDSDNYETVYKTIELTASAKEMELMKSLHNVKAVCGVTDKDVSVNLLKTLGVGESAQLQLVIGDQIAQNTGEYVNRLKTVWEEVDDANAKVTRDGFVTGMRTGTMKIKGYAVPADVETLLFEEGMAADVDRYDTVPSDAIIPIEATIKVAADTEYEQKEDGDKNEQSGQNEQVTPQPGQDEQVTPQPGQDEQATPQPEQIEQVMPQPEHAAVTVGTTLKGESGSVYRVIKFDEKNKEVIYIKYTGKSEKVTVPDKVVLENDTYKVVAIGTKAFANKKIKQVKIGNNVTFVGNSAFQGCKKLKKVKLGNKTVTIGTKAFFGCRSLKSVTISRKVKSIGRQAFYGCSKLKSVKINAVKLRKVGNNAFGKIDRKAVFKVPKKKYRYYKKLLNGRTGVKRPMTVKRK
ncbi:MAG: leucine-rich repeat protein [Eubacteriales bacterium]|nr:leucine-rich repeat protein [Eubacteriales bacterium]